MNCSTLKPSLFNVVWFLLGNVLYVKPENKNNHIGQTWDNPFLSVQWDTKLRKPLVWIG